jgi:hypothetical protein
VEAVLELVLPTAVEKISGIVVKVAAKTLGPMLRYFTEDLGDNLIPFLKKLYNRGMLDADSGFFKVIKFLYDNDYVGNTVVRDVIKLIEQSPDDFLIFINNLAKNNVDDAIGLLKASKATGLSMTQLSGIASKRGIPTNTFVKSIEGGISNSYKVIYDTKLLYSNGQLQPLFRGLMNKQGTIYSGTSAQVAQVIEEGFERTGRKSGYDAIRHIGSDFNSDQAVTSLSRDFGVASTYAGGLSSPNGNGIILVMDKRLSAVIDTQEMLKALDNDMPKSIVKIFSEEGEKTSIVEGIYGAALGNNEINLLGKPRIEAVVGWYPYSRTANSATVGRFVENPKYVGNQADWNHIKSIGQLKQLHNDNGISNHQRQIEWMQKKVAANNEPPLTEEDFPPFDIQMGNTAYWPKEVT